MTSIKIKTINTRSGNKLTSAIKDNGNSITFNSNNMTDLEILNYAEQKLNYTPIAKTNLTNIISKAERLSFC